MTHEELQTIRERALDSYPFGGSEEDVMKLLDYINELENMPLIKTIQKLQRENERIQEDYQTAYEEVLKQNSEIERLREVSTQRNVDLSNANEEIGKLKFQIASMRSALESVQTVMSNSYGVSGWHMNDEVATWSELCLEDEVADALNINQKVESHEGSVSSENHA